MTKTRAFLLMTSLFAVATAATAGPVHPCDDRVALGWHRHTYMWPTLVQPVAVRSVVVQQVARPMVVHTVAPAPTVVTVPAGSDVSIRQRWAGDAPMRISAPAGTATLISSGVISSGYRPAWVDSDAVVVEQGSVVTSPDVLVIPNNAVVTQNVVVEPFDAHDRLVVLNEFSRPGYDSPSIIYRDSTGLLHERTVYGRYGSVFYDHLGRRCRYDRSASMVVVLDSHVVRDYNRNGLCDDGRYIDLHRRAALDFHRSTLYHPPHQPHRSIATPYRGELNRFRHDSDPRNDRSNVRGNDRGNDRDRRPSVDRPRGPAVNGRTVDQSRLTGGERKSTRSTVRPKR